MIDCKTHWIPKYKHNNWKGYSIFLFKINGVSCVWHERVVVSVRVQSMGQIKLMSSVGH